MLVLVIHNATAVIIYYNGCLTVVLGDKLESNVICCNLDHGYAATLESSASIRIH